MGAVLAGLVLAGCRLDREDSLRGELSAWLNLGPTLEFASRGTCTGAVFLLEDITIGEGISRATSVEVAVHYLRAGRAVALELFDASPTVVSEQIMAASLEQGLGILSNGVGPAQRCLSERAGWAFYLAITSEEAVMVYDPEGNAVTVLHLQADMPLAFFLRGNV